jgi:hypothetical protein
MARPFRLFVDSGDEDEPEPRCFESLEAALGALKGYSKRHQRFAWIMEQRPDGSSQCHVKDGEYYV